MTVHDPAPTGPPRVAGRSTTWWGMVMAILVFSSMLSTFVFATLYLRPRSESWPPEGIEAPGLLLPTLSLLVAFASLVPVSWLHRSVRTASVERVQLGSLAGAVTGAAFVGLGVTDLLTVEFTVDVHVYGSLYFLTSVFQLTLAAAGVAILAGLPLHAWGERLSPRAEGMAVNTALYWYYVVSGWLVVYATLHLYPLLW